MFKIIALMVTLANPFGPNPVIVAKPIIKASSVERGQAPIDVCKEFASHISRKSGLQFKCEHVMAANGRPDVAALGFISSASSEKTFIALILNDGKGWFVADLFGP